MAFGLTRGAPAMGRLPHSGAGNGVGNKEIMY